ncbi:uncharacterized protein LOC122869040 isoform X3 [Siniperca chuatsi]|uniref:uncharacterized protein LOC122869040 isoform X3 n=1 Tax=Siniperca chuatsi TaxID=119488 RepID=UPI001CE1C081|nr:uncharacterized protein LOC122869040 isoform X3 [Siniperca chuatsi]
MSEENISLYDLLNLSIGTPHRGAVNFGALHALLHAVLRQLNIRDMKTRWRDTPLGHGLPDAPVGVTAAKQDHHAEEEHQIQRDLSTEEQDDRSDTELQERIASSSPPTPSSGPAADRRLRSRIETCEDDVSKAMKLIQELHNQKDNLKEEIKKLRHQQKVAGAEAEAVTAVEKCCHRVDALEETVSSLRDTFQKYPDPELLSQCVTWDVMQSTLLSEKENLQKERVNSGVVDPATVVQPAYTPFNSNFPAVNTAPSHTSTPSSSHPVEDTGRPAAPSSPSISGQISTLQEVTDARPATEAPSVLSGPPQQTHPKTGQTAAGMPLSRKASGSERYPETVEALRNISKLKERFNKLEARVAALEEGKVDHSQLTHLRELITNKGSQDASDNLMDQLNQQRALIDSLMSDREKKVELVNDVQKAILQLQAECEKLHETTRCLHEDNREKQSHIEELYKTTEELEEKKADKQMVESEIKADKSALESKVSRLQFDSVTEQLNTMFHELLNKVTGQEQDWHKVIDKLSTEMECKLNRIELDSVKKQLEGRWKNIHEKLQAQGAPELDDAAGLRKQLVDRFHCLSCDRPVVKYTPGPHSVKLPSSPGFPSHKSIRPFTVYALEQFRQHYRSLKPGTNRYNFEVANPGRRREQLQKSHAVMCRQIESVQKRLKHCDRAGSCDTVSNNLIQNQPGTLHERISEVTDYSHLPVSRSCGGIHTVTSAGQRRTGLQYMKHHTQTEVDGAIQSEEIDIVGLDGHIYRGRLNAPAMRNTETKLPTISTKDGMFKPKDKAKCSLSHKPTTSPGGGTRRSGSPPPQCQECPVQPLSLQQLGSGLARVSSGLHVSELPHSGFTCSREQRRASG